jgi:hypothetical protein
MSQCTRNGQPYGRAYTHHTVKQQFRALAASGLTLDEYLRQQKKAANDRYQHKLEAAESVEP